MEYSRWLRQRLKDVPVISGSRHNNWISARLRKIVAAWR